MATPMRSTDFRQVVEPILNEGFDGVYDQRKDEWREFLKLENGIERSYQEEYVQFGFGAAPELPDGSPVTYQSGGILYVQRYVYRVYGLAFALTKILVEDGDHVQIGRQYSKHLAQSLIETKETLAANVLNRGFNSSYAGGDGTSLINPAHPLYSGTYSNQLTTAANLSQTSLEQMLIQIRGAVDNNGKKIRIEPRKLILGPSNVFQGEVLLKSVLRTGTANNDINPIKSLGMLSGGQAQVARLTSNTNWFVLTDANDENGMKLLTRRKLTKTMEGDFETDSMRYKATERYAIGWTDWRCIFGTPGI